MIKTMNEIIRELLKAIKGIEWVWDEELNTNSCPECGEREDNGHSATCPVKIAIVNAEREIFPINS